MEIAPIIVEQVYPAPIAVVWKAITDPDQMRRWFFESMTDFKPEVGFATEFDVQAEGEIYPHQWKVIEVIPETRIAYSWRYGGYPGESTVTWGLNTEPDGTRLTLIHRGYETLEIGMPGDPRENCEAGWRYFLCQSLKEFLQSHMD